MVHCKKLTQLSVVIVFSLFFWGGCGDEVTETPAEESQESPEEVTTPVVRFNINDAQLLFIATGGEEDLETEKLKKLTASGVIEDALFIEEIAESEETTTEAALESGADELELPKTIFVEYGPSGELFIAFEQKHPYLEPPCALIQVSNDNAYQCIDDEVMGWPGINDEIISWWPWPGLSTVVAYGGPINFDYDGNLVYAAYICGEPGTDDCGEAVTVLRRKTNDGIQTYYLSNNLEDIRSFLYGPDGALYLVGWSDFRRVSPEGKVSVITDQTPYFYRVFSDGKLYATLNRSPLDDDYDWGFWRIEFGDAGINFTEVLEDVSSIYYATGDEIFTLKSTSTSTYNQETHRYEYEYDYSIVRHSSFFGDPSEVKSVSIPLGSEYPYDFEIQGEKVFFKFDTGDWISNLYMLDMQNENKTYDLLAGQIIEMYEYVFSSSANKVYLYGQDLSNSEYILGEIDLNQCDSTTLICSWSKIAVFASPGSFHNFIVKP